MLKYKIDNVIEGKENEDHVAYIQLYDDAAPDVKLAQMCLAYADDTQFETELIRKTEKVIESGAVATIIAGKISGVLAKVEAGLEATCTRILAEKTTILEKVKP